MSAEELSRFCADSNAPEIVALISDIMRYDNENECIVLDIGNEADPSFPDDPDLDSGPLTLAVWKMVLAELADALPPWDEP